MRIFSADQVHAACDYPALVDALARFHLEDTDLVDEQLLAQPAAGGSAAARTSCSCAAPGNAAASSAPR